MYADVVLRRYVLGVVDVVDVLVLRRDVVDVVDIVDVGLRVALRRDVVVVVDVVDVVLYPSPHIPITIPITTHTIP